jgi:6-phosphogluconolactonase
MKLRYFLWMAMVIVPSFICAKGRPQAPKTNSQLTLLVGTYTEGSTSKGIYVYRFDEEKGTAKYVSYAPSKNPSFLVATDNNRFVYAVNEYGNSQAAAESFRLDKQKGKLTPVNKQPTSEAAQGGEDPCNILTNGRQVVTANYSGGDISLYNIAKDGSLLPLVHRFTYSGKAAGKKAHIHCVKITPDGKYMFATDLGNDRIYRFNVDNTANYQNKKLFISHSIVAYEGKDGMGPRHFVFDKTGQYMYAIHELGGIVVVFRYHDGTLTPLQTIMADEGNGHGSADIHISPDGKFLYTSHRLKKDGIAIFSIHPSTGLLTKVGYQQTGKHPRNFNITPNGKFVLVACRDNNDIEVFKRNASNGLLSDTHYRIQVGKPVCVQFLK